MPTKAVLDGSGSSVVRTKGGAVPYPNDARGGRPHPAAKLALLGLCWLLLVAAAVAAVILFR